MKRFAFAAILAFAVLLGLNACCGGEWGQFCIIMPDKNLVVAINAHTGDPGAIITSVFKNVYGNFTR